MEIYEWLVGDTAIMLWTKEKKGSYKIFKRGGKPGDGYSVWIFPLWCRRSIAALESGPRARP